jgi:hypothetical protein
MAAFNRIAVGFLLTPVLAMCSAARAENDPQGFRPVTNTPDRFSAQIKSVTDK